MTELTVAGRTADTDKVSDNDSDVPGDIPADMRGDIVEDTRLIHGLSTVLLRSQPVELYKILKFEGLAESGAAAKLLIDAGQVEVNGQIEYRRRRKIVGHDRIRFQNRLFAVEVEAGSVVDDAG